MSAIDLVVEGDDILARIAGELSKNGVLTMNQCVVPVRSIYAIIDLDALGASFNPTVIDGGKKE